MNHKRTFLFLEQVILKHDAHKNTVSIKAAPNGLDFFFAERSSALKFLDFVQSVVPSRTKNSKQLISADLKSNTFNYKVRAGGGRRAGGGVWEKGSVELG